MYHQTRRAITAILADFEEQVDQLEDEEAQDRLSSLLIELNERLKELDHDTAQLRVVSALTRELAEPAHPIEWGVAFMHRISPDAPAKVEKHLQQVRAWGAKAVGEDWRTTDPLMALFLTRTTMDHAMQRHLAKWLRKIKPKN